MNIVTLFFIAVGLAMDAFAVSVSNSLCYRGIAMRQVTVNSLTFGVFQGVMPLLGFFAGRAFAGVIQSIDHWVALILLGFIGGKMLLEGIRALRSAEGCCTEPAVYTGRTLFTQAVATSIDALAVGVSFAALSVNIWTAVAFIAAITFVCCLIGGRLGQSFGALLGDWAQILGGAILVGIGLKIFIEHVFLGG